MKVGFRLEGYDDQWAYHLRQLKVVVADEPRVPAGAGSQSHNTFSWNTGRSDVLIGSNSLNSRLRPPLWRNAG
jgi:hypothetical protein